MKRTLPLIATTLLALTLSACATTEDKKFGDRAWDKSKDTTDQVADETVDAMKKTEEKTQGFFENLWH